MFNGAILVRAIWDPEARVSVATSDDVRGLVAEAATTDALHAKLAVLVPELLELNADPRPRPSGRTGSEKGWENVPLDVLYQHVSTGRLSA
nr:DUF1902 domain-containing protein [uncultured Rhodopila sp.]